MQVRPLAWHLPLASKIAAAVPAASLPNVFGEPGLDAKSSISLLRKKPATVTPLPNPVLSVVVSATAMPRASTVHRLVVWSPSSSAVTWRDGVALSVIVANSWSRYARDTSLATGTSLTYAGSPSSSLRAANARRQISVSQWMCSAPYHSSLPTSSLPSMPAVIASTTPPDDGSGIDAIEKPRYENRR